MRRRRILDAKGDTIVEVLIAIAVVSSVLGGAFATANRSLLATRQSQERAEAMKYLEGQVESLKAAIGDDTKIDGVFTTTGDFCFSDAIAIVTAAASCRRGTDNRYQLAINRTPHPTAPNGSIFTATAAWAKIGGGSQEAITIVYRAYRQ
jgi:type II secretory pathway pseudopilin PulG